jgi:hypothetical protein
MNIPSWIWYVGGAILFVLVYLYIKSSSSSTTNPIGQNVTVPSAGDLANYNGSADILAQTLNMQAQEIQHLAANQPPTTASK